MIPGTTVRIVGGLFPAQLVERIASGDSAVPGTAPADYHFDTATELNQGINRAWTALSGRWAAYKAARALLPEGDRATTLTRERWLLPLLQELGYGRLQPERTALEADGRAFALSHRWGRVPIHLVGAGISLDKRIPGERGAAASAPHALVQDFLNHDDNHLWAFVSNGLELRILRDHHSLTQQAYVTFDLETLFDGEQFSAFRLLFLLCHVSRVEGDDPRKCRLEQWVTLAREDGVRALDRLRAGVEVALAKLGSGFVAHRANEALRARLASGQLSTQEFYRQLLRLVYRLLFLFVAEDRDLLLVPDAHDAAKDRYRRLYATRRLRTMALRRRGSPHDDAWQCLRLVMRHLDRGCPELALPALGSFLWGTEQREGQRVSRALPDLDGTGLDNEHLYAALAALCAVQDGPIRRPVDWAGVQSDELGSVYESLMEKVPRVNAVAGTFELADAAGNERKTTGSYYTPSSLVDCLLDSALDPVLEEAARKPDPERAILELAVVDPACGSGHFLVAAARRIARRLARVRSGGIEPSPPEVQHALRDVVGRCIYGVDLNPMAVELCKVSLWMEAMEPGRPLSFLDAHVRHGNALLGTTAALMAKGIPDAAWDPIEGDDKKVASALKKRNKKHAVEEQLAWSFVSSSGRSEAQSVARAVAALEAEPDANAEGVARKESQWDGLLGSPAYQHEKFVADAWCAAFAWPKEAGALADAAPTNDLWRQLRDAKGRTPELTTKTVEILAAQYHFFHWELAFPQVFTRGGFDVVLGNPPWERNKPEPSKWFSESRPDIAAASTSAERGRLLSELRTESPILWQTWATEERKTIGTSHFLTASGRHPRTAVGKFNLGSVFVELSDVALNPVGRAGVLSVSGIATDDAGSVFISNIMSRGRLVSLFDFENRLGIFPAIDSRMKFCAITLRGSDLPSTPAAFVFFAHSVEDLADPHRLIRFTADDINLLNPISQTCPVFRSVRQASIVKRMYRRAGLETAGEKVLFRWPIRPTFMFVMSDHSSLFKRPGDIMVPRELSSQAVPHRYEGVDYLPLYESKMFHIYDHRWASLSPNDTSDENDNSSEVNRVDPGVRSASRYWMRACDVVQKLPESCNWLIAIREVTNATNERTAIAAILPPCPVGHNAQVILPHCAPALSASFVSCFNSFVFDFATRTKVGGSHLSAFILRQLPVLGADDFHLEVPWQPGTLLRDWILPRVLELTYTAWDLEPFARDVGYDGPPFRWDPERRFLLRCELDAAFFHLYGLSRDDTDYVMDTFPIVRKNDEKAHGEYRTKRVILEMYDAMAEATRTGKPYETRLDPPPADPRVAHPDTRSEGS